MSTAARVPETWDLTGDDAREALARTGRTALLLDSLARLRAADGTSHARSLALATSLVAVQGLIVVVGFAAAFGSSGFGGVIVDAIRSAAPGPAGETLTAAVSQASKVGHGDRFLPLAAGLLGLLVTATTAFGQLERGLNRLYGIEQDRPTVQKYVRAFLLAITIGSALTLAFGLLAAGRVVGTDSGALGTAWQILRWPLGLALATVAFGAILRFAPARRQPGGAWLAFAALICVIGWAAVTLALGAMFTLSSTFGQTYGALAGIVALQLWTMLSSFAIFFGASVAAQLEAVRAGVPAPDRREQSAHRDNDEPDHGQAELGRQAHPHAVS